MMKIIKLYNLKKGSRIKESVFNNDGKKIGNYIVFDHIDGMYSYCTVEGTDEVIHLSAFAPLIKIGDNLFKISK